MAIAEKMVKRYILRTDRPGKVIPRTKLQSTKQYIGEKALNVSNTFGAYKGDLFEDSPDDQQPEDEHKIVVVLMGDSSKVLEVSTDDLAEISDATADLLFAVDSSYRRFELFSKRGFLDEAITAKVNDKCEVIDKYKKKQEGVIRYIGGLDGKNGRYFGIDFVNKESASGYGVENLQARRRTRSSDKCDILATVDQITFKAPLMDKRLKKDQVKSFSREIEMVEQYESLEQGMEVVVFHEDSLGREKVLVGTIRFIGRTSKDEDMQVGIELDTPDGSGSGVFAGESVFKCKRNHALFTNAKAVMRKRDYDGQSHDEYDIIEKQNVKPQVRNDRMPTRMTATSHKKSSTKNEILAEQKDQIERIRESHSSFPLSSRNASEPNYLIDSNHIDSISLTTPYLEERTYRSGKRGPASLPFYNDHFGMNSYKGFGVTEATPSTESHLRYAAAVTGELVEQAELPITEKRTHKKTPSFIDPNLQVNSMVQIDINGVPEYGLIKWIGYLDETKSNELIAGLELEQTVPFGNNGYLSGKKYFDAAPGRGFFQKLSKCKRDQRFSSISHSSEAPVNQDVEEIKGNFLPPAHLEDVATGRMRGIQGHHNSCYLDATLFAMFAFSVAFDSVLYRKKRHTDIYEYEQVRDALKNAIVNPLRKKGFVNAASILRLRRWLDRLGNVQGFMNEEKDPEEFLMLLLKDVLKVDPFLKIRTNDNVLDESYFYQILVDRDENNPLPTLQYLIELSFHTGLFYLEEVPSVLVVQLPRSGQQKMYKRIRVNPVLDISSVMSTAKFSCHICEKLAEFSCRECCHSFGWEHPFIYFCPQCNEKVHQHSMRRKHKVNRLKWQASNGYKVNKDMPKMELFAVVCIKTSHYVSFTKFGESPNEKWMFFDSMADRVGGESGHNVPMVVQCPEIKDWFNGSPLKFTESDSKNTPEMPLRLFEDASLCLYRNSGLSLYK